MKPEHAFVFIYYLCHVCACHEVCRKKSWSTSQMPSSKARLFWACALLSRVHAGMQEQHWDQTCPPLMAGRLWGIFFEGAYYRAVVEEKKKKTALWHMKIFASGAWFPHSLVFWQWGWTRQSCWSSLPVQPVLHKRAKVTMEGWAGTLRLMQ